MVIAERDCLSSKKADLFSVETFKFIKIKPFAAKLPKHLPEICICVQTSILKLVAPDSRYEAPSF